MKIEFHRTGAERKALVTAIGEILEVKPKYKGMPSAAYEIDYFTVTKDGSLKFDDMADSEDVEHLLESLADRGIAAGTAETAQAWLDARADELSRRAGNRATGRNYGAYGGNAVGTSAGRQSYQPSGSQGQPYQKGTGNQRTAD